MIRIFNKPRDYCTVDSELFQTATEDLKAKSPEQVTEAIQSAYTILQAAMRVFHSQLIQMEQVQTEEIARQQRELRARQLSEKMQEQRRADHKRVASGPLHTILVQNNLSEAEFIEDLVSKMKAFQTKGDQDSK